MRRRMVLVVMVLAAGEAARGEDLVYKERMMAVLVRRVPEILKTFDAVTGAFGQGVWMSTDQNAMYPLAVAYATPSTSNKYYKDSGLLAVIVRAGDRLIAEADEKGRWVFTKKDGSTWGSTWMPWAYSRWIRTFELIRADMPADRRAAWEKALTLGYGQIGETQLRSVHNIPTHHAMGLCVAGRVLDRPDWCRRAADFMARVVAEQAEGGYWSEGGGPVVVYNYVYIEALGIYHAVSGDRSVLPALERAAEFHRHFTYPDGSNVETIDQRNPYRPGPHPGNVGFTFSEAGRAHLKAQWAALGMDRLEADLMAALVEYGREGPISPPAGAAGELFVLKEKGQDKAAVLRRGPWFVCVSATTSPVAESRWHQDRQNVVSLFHDRVGLIAGGGNTKLQPAWSTFTVGDASLLRHKPGDTDPDFRPPAGRLFHVPSAARLLREPHPGLEMTCGPETCRLAVEPQDERTLACTWSATAVSGMPVVARITLLPHLGEVLETGAGRKFTLGDSPLSLSAGEVGGSLSHGGWHLAVPKGATLTWPALPHNPYRKDGRAETKEGLLSVAMPLDAEPRECTVILRVTR